MDFEKEISRYAPQCEQEANDQKVILAFTHRFRDTVLLRDNEIAHITSSGFIMSPTLSKVLLVHHIIRNTWAWTGGHADGNPDLLQVAIKEAKEETGVLEVRPLSEKIFSIDILPVFGHKKNGRYVSAHLHLSIAYLLICDELQATKVKPDENTGVAWFETGKFTNQYFNSVDVDLYHKLIKRALCFQRMRDAGENQFTYGL